MKHTYPSRELPHIWANLSRQEIKEGRYAKGSGGAESFNGADYRSYSAVIARHVFSAKGERAIVYSNKRYSNSTSKDQSQLRGALHGETFTVTTSANVTGREVRANLIEQAEAAIEAASKARTSAEWRLNEAARHIEAAERARVFFGLRVKPYAPDLSTAIADAKGRNAKAKAKAAKLEATRAKLAAVYVPQLIAFWRAREEQTDACKALREKAAKAGVRALASDGLKWGDSMLRLNADGSRVETNRGAQVLVRTVRFLWAFCRHARANGAAVEGETIERFPRLDHYTVHAIDEKGNLLVGCHRIAFEEVETIARQLDLPPFDGSPAEVPAVPVVETVAA